jgi:hypothetical protein
MLDQEFVGGAPPGLAPRDYYQGNFSSMLLNADGKAYYRSPTGGNVTVFFTYMFANFPMEYAGRVLKVDKIIPSVAENSFFFAVYDKDNKRFLFISAGSALANGIACPATITADGEHLDYNNTGDAEILYSAFYREAISSPAYSITLYAKDGNVYVQTAQCTGDRQMSSSLPVKILRHELFSGQGEISPDTKYWQLKTRDYLFFGTANRLYWYDHATSETHLFHTFPVGANVVDMDSNPQESELGVVLSNGSFVTLNIENARLMLDNNKIYEISVPGRIVDLEYKFPDYFTYASRQYRGD